jgi:hypothetical protein
VFTTIVNHDFYEKSSNTKKNPQAKRIFTTKITNIFITIVKNKTNKKLDVCNRIWNRFYNLKNKKSHGNNIFTTNHQYIDNNNLQVNQQIIWVFTIIVNNINNFPCKNFAQQIR